jgi:hypothetical protein
LSSVDKRGRRAIVAGFLLLTIASGVLLLDRRDEPADSGCIEVHPSTQHCDDVQPSDVAAYEVSDETIGPLDRRVPVRARIENIGDEAGAPRCVLSAFSRHAKLGPVRPRVLQPGETGVIRGVARFRVPLFNYESDGEAFGVRCFPELPKGVSRAVSRERRVAAPRMARVPRVDGQFLHAAAAVLLQRGFRLEISEQLREVWKQQGGAKAPSLDLIAMNLVLARGPRVSTSPAPGTLMNTATAVRLLPVAP